ncbi:uncharacterized protein [Littorina saxatilis]|uniref:uncharacterized protein isoform X2 n=2 Tax=Littorina saxatilis TaxID=31220 RepID=UPI0038B5A3B3
MHVVSDQAGQPVVASQPAKQSLQPSVRHQNCASMVGLPAEQSPTEDLTIPHADKDADSELDAQFEYSDVSDDDNKVPLNVTDDDSDDTVEDVHDFHFLDDCAEDSTNVTENQNGSISGIVEKTCGGCSGIHHHFQQKMTDRDCNYDAERLRTNSPRHGQPH